jgi:hypothetical protein
MYAAGYVAKAMLQQHEHPTQAHWTEAAQAFYAASTSAVHADIAAAAAACSSASTLTVQLAELVAAEALLREQATHPAHMVHRLHAAGKEQQLVRALNARMPKHMDAACWGQ